MRRLVALSILLGTLAAGAGPAAADELRAFFPPGEKLRQGLELQSFDLYTAETLWERINGEAELHRSYGLMEAAYGLYAAGSEWERTLQIALFRMPDSLSAFGLYSAYRPPGRELALGNGAAADESQAYLWHGPWFAALEAFGPDDFARAALRAGIESLASALGPVPAPPRAVAALKDFVDAATVIYRPDHLLGRAAMPPGVEGRSADGRTFFMATAGGSMEDVLSAYGAILENSGTEETDSSSILRGTDPVRGPVAVASGGNRLAGIVHSGEISPSGEELARLLRAAPALP